MKQPADAAAMYELGGQDDRAAAIYVAGKDLDRAGAVISRVTLPKLLGQYAKACEITGRWVIVELAVDGCRFCPGTGEGGRYGGLLGGKPC